MDDLKNDPPPMGSKHMKGIPNVTWPTFRPFHTLSYFTPILNLSPRMYSLHGIINYQAWNRQMPNTQWKSMCPTLIYEAGTMGRFLCDGSLCWMLVGSILRNLGN